MGDFNTPLTAMDRSSRQKINKETQAPNEALDQMDLIGHATQKQQNTHSSQVHMEHSKIDHILGYKSNLSNFNKT